MSNRPELLLRALPILSLLERLVAGQVPRRELLAHLACTQRTDSEPSGYGGVRHAWRAEADLTLLLRARHHLQSSQQPNHRAHGSQHEPHLQWTSSHAVQALQELLDMSLWQLSSSRLRINPPTLVKGSWAQPPEFLLETLAYSLIPLPYALPYALNCLKNVLPMPNSKRKQQCQRGPSCSPGGPEVPETLRNRSRKG